MNRSYTKAWNMLYERRKWWLIVNSSKKGRAEEGSLSQAHALIYPESSLGMLFAH